MPDDLKPLGVKAPLHLLPARALRAVAAAMEHGAVKYTPWNWQDNSQAQARKEELLAAALRHLTAVTDPSEDSLDAESGLHHAAHAVASLLIYLWKEGEDYRPSKLLQEQDENVDIDWHSDVSFGYCQHGAKPDECPVSGCGNQVGGPSYGRVGEAVTHVRCRTCHRIPPAKFLLEPGDLCPYCNPTHYGWPVRED